MKRIITTDCTNIQRIKRTTTNNSIPIHFNLCKTDQFLERHTTKIHSRRIKKPEQSSISETELGVKTFKHINLIIFYGLCFWCSLKKNLLGSQRIFCFLLEVL